jgi:hypothetical protein
MSENITTRSVKAEVVAENPSLSNGALARRHMLLKSLGKGSVVVAAASIPLQSLASTVTITHPGTGGRPAVRCSISGMMSGVHSRETVTTVCSGYSPGKYKKIENWPNYRSGPNNAINVVDGISFDKNTKFKALFGSGLDVGLLEIMNSYSSSNEFHWITALLNAVGGAPSSFYFPYSASEVRAFYMGNGPFTAAQALDFFKTYMETHP